MRDSGYTAGNWRWGEHKGFRVVPAPDCWGKSPDPACAPGTGTPEIAGLIRWRALELVRGCAGLNLVDCDLVEVSPPYETTGNTVLTAANLLFEMLCVLP